jgi:hypothetical protein
MKRDQFCWKFNKEGIIFFKFSCLVFCFLTFIYCSRSNIETDNSIDNEPFILSQTFEGDWNPGDLVLADFNGDDNLDIFISAAPNSFILWNQGNGQYTPPDFSNNFDCARYVVRGDFDLDNDLDLVLSDTQDQLISLWINNGTNFIKKSNITNNAIIQALDTGDLDSDGDLDLLLGVTNGVDQVWFNDGQANFSKSTQDLNVDIPLRIELADLDGDNDLDAVVGNALEMINFIYFNDGSGGLSIDRNLLGQTHSTLAVSIADFNNDGNLDIFLGYHDGMDTLWLNNGGTGFFNTNQVFSNGWTYDSDTGDLDNDGDLDLAIAGGNVQDSVWINNGRGEFEMLQTSFLGNQGCGVCVGDLDQDGDLDLVFTHDPGQSPTGKVYIWFNNF